MRDGACDPIPPSEFLAWCSATGNIVYPSEYAILCAMDGAFCSEMGKELSDYADRRQAEAEEAAKRKGR